MCNLRTGVWLSLLTSAEWNFRFTGKGNFVLTCSLAAVESGCKMLWWCRTEKFLYAHSSSSITLGCAGSHHSHSICSSGWSMHRDWMEKCSWVCHCLLLTLFGFGNKCLALFSYCLKEYLWVCFELGYLDKLQVEGDMSLWHCML